MRIRPTVRLRLTLLYSGLFLLAGALLLVVNYGLVRSRLGTSSFQLEFQSDPDAEASPSDLERQLGGDPMAGDGTVDGDDIQVFERGAEEIQRNIMRELALQSGVALGVMAVVSLGMGWLVAGRVLRPLHRITGTARRLSEENLHERIDLEGPQDELKELADTFDAMLARLDAAFEAQRRFIANASHELRTPLAIQRTLLDVALADPERGAAELDAVADDMRVAITRTERLIDGLLVLARSERQVERWHPLDLRTAASDAVDLVAAEAASRHVTIELVPGPARCHGEPALVERAVANLVDNAVRHNVDGGWARVVTSTSDGFARIVVVNTGPEVAVDELPKLFEPFRRLADRTGSAEGAGLGLSIVQSIAEMHGGDVRAVPRPGGGLEVELRIPGSHPDRPPGSAPSPEAAPVVLDARSHREGRPEPGAALPAGRELATSD